MASFKKFIETFSNNKNVKGKQFEYFVRSFLKKDKYWKSVVDKIWFFKDAPINWGSDVGTDLIFIDKNKRYWAVQAKFYNQNYSITKKDINSFLSDSNRPKIYKRILITTTNKFSRQGLQTIKAQEKQVQIYTLDDFERNGNIYPSRFSKVLNISKKIKLKERDHQKKAILKVCQGFKKEKKGQLIMACGTGKTLTCFWIHKKLKSKKTLVLVPSLNLMSQTIREWYDASEKNFESLCICSDPSTVKNIKDDEILLDPSEVPYSVTWDLQEIKNFLKVKKEYVVFVTYQSSPLLSRAQRNLEKHTFDLSIADEAHRCAGKLDSEFSFILNDKKIKSKKKLFTTATPKIYSDNIKKQAETLNTKIVDMEDTTLFGKRFFNYTFSQAIRNKQLADYKLIAFGVKDKKINAMIKQQKYVKIKKQIKTDAMSLAAQIGLVKSIKKYKLKKIITFHGNIAKSKNFSESFPLIYKWTKSKYKSKDILVADYVSGMMSTYSRKIKLDTLKNITKDEVGILSNSKCLGEGVDVPTLDGVSFFDPKRSEIDIIQSVGRAIRKPTNVNKDYGYILVPVFIDKKENFTKIVDKTNFKPVLQIINALRSHDDALNAEIEELKLGAGKKSVVGRSKKIIFDLPFSVSKNFQDKISAFVINKIPNDWDLYFKILKQYQDEFNTTIMSQKTVFKNYTIGRWANDQRTKYKKKLLSNSQIENLESLLDWSWVLNISKWDKMYNLLNEYVEKNNRIPSNNESYRGLNLGIWTGHQRAFYRNKKLTKIRIVKLERINGWFWEINNDDLWYEFYNDLVKYYKKNNSSHVERSRKETDEKKVSLGSWVGRQRALYKKNKLEKWKIKLFEKNFPDWFWSFLDHQWMQAYMLLNKYFIKNSTSRVPQKFKTEGIDLGSWVSKQRDNFKNKKISQFRIKKLELFNDWFWSEEEREEYDNNLIFIKFKNFYMNNKEEFILKDIFFHSNKELKKDSNDIRRKYKSNLLSKFFIKKMETLKYWEWDPLEAKWYKNFKKLKLYYKKYKNTKLKRRTELGSWISWQRTRYKDGVLEKYRIKLLESTFSDWYW